MTQPIDNDENITDIMDDMTMWSSLWFWLMALYYPPPAGFVRISYICVCTHRSLYIMQQFNTL